MIPQPPPAAAPRRPRSPRRPRRPDAGAGCRSPTASPSRSARSTATISARPTGDSGGKTENDLVGAELTFRALPGFLGGVSLKQMGLWSLNGIDDGLTGRSVASLDFAPDFGIFRPTLAINGGGVYGKGVQDGFVAGPEIRFDIAPFGGFNIGLKAAYDYQFRNAGWDEGIALGRPGPRHPVWG